MKQPLLGRKVLVTRAQSQARELCDAIVELGGEPIEFAVISFQELPDSDKRDRLDAEISKLSKYDWIFFTSVNGVEFFIRRLHDLNLDTHAMSRARIAAIGPKTAEVLRNYGLSTDLLPKANEYVSEGLVSALKPFIKVGDKALLPTANIARNVIANQLTELGVEVTQVTVYENVLHTENGQEAIDLLRNKEIPILTFTSSSTVRNLFAALQMDGISHPLDLLAGLEVVCIGTKTADTAREFGLHVSATAKEFTIPGLVQSLVELCEAKE